MDKKINGRINTNQYLDICWIRSIIDIKKEFAKEKRESDPKQEFNMRYRIDALEDTSKLLDMILYSKMNKDLREHLIKTLGELINQL